MTVAGARRAPPRAGVVSSPVAAARRRAVRVLVAIGVLGGVTGPALMGCSEPEAQTRARRTPVSDGGPGIDGGSSAAPDDLCPPGGCGAPAGAACRWDLDCRQGLVCHRGTCAAAVDPGPDAARPDPPDRDSGPGAPDGSAPVGDVGTPDAGRPADRDAGSPGDPDVGGGGDCVDPGQGCPLVCGEPDCTERCGDVDGDRFITVCDAHYLVAARRLTFCQQIMGDLDLDGAANAADAQRILDYVRTGDPALLGCGELPPGM